MRCSSRYAPRLQFLLFVLIRFYICFFVGYLASRRPVGMVAEVIRLREERLLLQKRMELLTARLEQMQVRN